MRQVVWLLLVGCAGCGPAVKVGPIEEKKGPEKEVVVKEPPRDDPTKRPEPFALPSDDGGRLLARALRPALPAGLSREQTQRPPAPSPPASLDVPTALPETVLAPPRLPAASRGGTARPSLEESVLLAEQSIPVSLPARVVFAAPKPVRVKSVDVTIPPVLPHTATPLPDRVSLDDPAPAQSVAAVLVNAPTGRTAPAPYLRLALPDPFEHRRPLSLALPGEAITPQVEGPRPPR